MEKANAQKTSLLWGCVARVKVSLLSTLMSSLPLLLYLRLYDSRRSYLANSAIKLALLHTTISRYLKLSMAFWSDPRKLLRQALWTNWHTTLLWNVQCWGCLILVSCVLFYHVVCRCGKFIAIFLEINYCTFCLFNRWKELLTSCCSRHRVKFVHALCTTKTQWLP